MKNPSPTRDILRLMAFFMNASVLVWSAIFMFIGMLCFSWMTVTVNGLILTVTGFALRYMLESWFEG